MNHSEYIHETKIGNRDWVYYIIVAFMILSIVLCLDIYDYKNSKPEYRQIDLRIMHEGEYYQAYIKEGRYYIAAPIEGYEVFKTIEYPIEYVRENSEPTIFAKTKK